jgi:hypothetical protein
MSSKKIRGTSHRRRHGWLNNNNAVGDFSKAQRCGARTRKGTPCQCPAMKNGRCRLHGGLSTGPKTVAGIERIRQAVTKHGFYTKAAVLQRQLARFEVKQLQQTIRNIRKFA